MKLRFGRRHRRYRRLMAAHVTIESGLIHAGAVITDPSIRIIGLSQLLAGEIIRFAKTDPLAAKIAEEEAYGFLDNMSLMAVPKPKKVKPAPPPVVPWTKPAPKVALTTPPTGAVYFVQQHKPDGSGPIKIGFTRNLQERIGSLQTGSPHDLVLLAHVAGNKVAERELHHRFASDRLSGEWFRPSAALVDFIVALGTK